MQDNTSREEVLRNLVPTPVSHLHDPPRHIHPEECFLITWVDPKPIRVMQSMLAVLRVERLVRYTVCVLLKRKSEEEISNRVEIIPQ